MTKAQQQIINSYKKSTAYSLDDVYANYSVFKARAEKKYLPKWKAMADGAIKF